MVGMACLDCATLAVKEFISERGNKESSRKKKVVVDMDKATGPTLGDTGGALAPSGFITGTVQSKRLQIKDKDGNA